MTTKFNMTRDINGYNGFGLAFSDTNYNTTLAAGVAQSLTIPSDSAYYLVVFAFEPGATIWVADNQTAVVPGVSFAATFSDLNPAARLVKAGDVLSFITSDTTAVIGVSLYAV
jgi:hypothetical protein